MLSASQMVMVKKAVESLFDGVCDVVILEKNVDKNGITDFFETTLYEKVPCRLAYTQIAPTQEDGDADKIVQKGKLFLAKEYAIPAGSKIIVTQNGKTSEYLESGQAACYATHQEILLVKWNAWA